MSGTFATTAIITKGLTGAYDDVSSPCKTGIITSWFSLYSLTDLIYEPRAGGPYPGDAWNKLSAGEVANFYKPVDPDLQYYILPRDKEAEYFRRHMHVVLNIQLGDFTLEKEYSIPEGKEKSTIQVVKVANTTVQRVVIGVEKVKQLATRMVATISNVHKRKNNK
jgi:hypothetical protein